MSRIDDLIESGDTRGLLREWAKSEIAELDGRFCQCAEPDLTGRKSYLCFACGMKNMARKAEIEAAMIAPHEYEVIERFKGGIAEHLCCAFCSMPRTHPRHAEGRPEAQEPATGEG